MPFTLSHIAAVAPFSRPLARWRLLSATIIGSMVPDFGLFLPVRPTRIETHSIMGLVTFCLPMGLVTFWIFQHLIKTSLLEILPDATYSRWLSFAAPADIRNPLQWVAAVCGVELGAITHLIWDGFTHEGARGIRMVPILDDPAVEIAGHHLVGARLLQDVSSILGLCVVLATIAYGLRPLRTAVRPVRRLGPMERFSWTLLFLLLTAVLTGLFLVIRRPHFAAGPSFALMIGNYAIAALRGFAAAVVLVSLGLKLRDPRR